MKAAIVTKYGSPEVVVIKELKKPIPKANEVLVKIYSTTITSGDARIRGAKFPQGFAIPAKLALGLFAPRKKILGSEFSGVIEQIGNKVKNFKVGDEVIGIRVFNIHAQYTCINENHAIILKPTSLNFDEAASIPFGATTALHFLNKSKYKTGEEILINGASGAVGSAAVQISKAFGLNITGVCSKENSELVKSLGADQVIDYKTEDFTKTNKTYDMIFDTVGNLTYKKCEHSLNPNGRFLAAVAGLNEMISMSFKKKKNNKKFIAGTAGEKKEDLLILSKMIKSGKLKPVIDRTFGFEDIAKAHAHVDQGHKIGSVVIKIHQ